MVAFSAAIATGALGRLTRLFLGGNRIGNPGIRAIANACTGGALVGLEQLMLFKNRISDEGMISLAEAIGKGALANLEALDLRYNRISDAGMKVFAEVVVRRKCLAKLDRLFLNGNPGDWKAHRDKAIESNR
eukprot:5741827-Prymnesium_polylepis.1